MKAVFLKLFRLYNTTRGLIISGVFKFKLPTPTTVTRQSLNTAVYH